jgi:hypothetical protein
LWKSIVDAFLLARDSTLANHMGNPGKADMAFVPKIQHDYLAAEFGVSGSSKDGRWVYGLAYVLSRTYGNYTGYFDQEVRYVSGGSATLSLQTTPERLARLSGLLPSDRTHSIKLLASYKFKFGLTAGTNLIVMSGTPLSEYTGGYYWSAALDLVSQRGTAGRLPMVWDLNFRLAYALKKLPLRFSMDLFHVGNPQQVVDQVQQKYTDSYASVLNPSFGKAVRRQPPMAVRFGIEYTF